MLIIAGIIVSGVLIAGGSALYINRRNNKVDPPANTPKETINFAPTSPVEQKETDDHKDELVKDQPATTPPAGTSNGKKAVTPTITNADSQSINSYVMGIFEEDGTCTATFTRNGTTRTKTSAGFGNVSYTQCAPMDLESGFLSAGTWQVVVSYSSAKAEGASAAKEIVIK